HDIHDGEEGDPDHRGGEQQGGACGRHGKDPFPYVNDALRVAFCFVKRACHNGACPCRGAYLTIPAQRS
ncbi:MAG: hypothetical protein VYD00_05980, partial [Pseudomonadota bacterium]|nr:hypothetical protein [Pseudomonadota bacterium]